MDGKLSNVPLMLVHIFCQCPSSLRQTPILFFTHFERTADAKKEEDFNAAAILTGMAQQAHSALSATDRLSYAKVKSVVLKAYELVPEAYRLFGNK